MMLRVGKAPYRRAKILAAVIEAVASLTPLKIQNAWNASYLHPFYGIPNYTRDREIKLLLQLPKEERLVLLKKMIMKQIAGGKKLEDVEVLKLIPKEEKETLIKEITEWQNAQTQVVQVQKRKKTEEY